MSKFWSNPKVDLRKVHDKACKVDGGMLYVCGKVVQVWWKGWTGAETWTAPSAEEALINYRAMKARWA